MDSSADRPGNANANPMALPREGQAGDNLNQGAPLPHTLDQLAEGGGPTERSLPLLTAIIASAQDAIVSSDLNERIETWNPAAERLFGYTAAEAIGQPFSLIAPAAAAEHERRDFLDKVVRDGGALCRETQRRRRDGSTIDVEMTVTGIRDASGTVRGYVSISRDISDRKEQERKLLALEDRYRTFFEKGPGLTYIYTPDLEMPDHGVLHLSQQFAELTGYGNEYQDGDQDFIQSVVHPADRDRVRALNRECEATGAPLRAAYRITTRDGKVRWIWDQANLVTDETGAPLYWLGFMIDITDRKLAEAELEASDLRFRTIFAGAPIGMAVIGPDMRVVQVNRALCTLLGYTEDELLATTIHEVTHPEDVGLDAAEALRALHGEITGYELEKRFIRKDGQVVWGHLSVSVVTDQAGTPLYAVSQVQDITARKASETAVAHLIAELQASNRELERLNAAKSEFVSTISHEFRTPLTSIQGFSELLETEELTLDEVRAFARTVNQNAVRLARMIGDVLDLDALEAGHREIRRAPLSLNQLGERVLAAMQPVAARHQLVAQLDPGIPAVLGDPDLLERVITNLVANAVKYSPAGSPITLTTAPRRDGVELTVADHGIGVPAEHRETIFARYGRIARPEQIGIEGTGLGLPIARHILEVHNGRIWVTDNTPSGAVFHVMLPAAESR